MHLPNLIRLAVLVRLAVVSVILATAAPPALRAQDPAPGSVDVARVFGTIADRRSGRPIPAAAITLAPDSASPPWWSGTTDGGGRFRSDVLPLGEYHLTVEVIGFARLDGSVALEERGAIDVRIEMVGVDFELEPLIAFATRRSRLDQVGFYGRKQMGRGFFVDRLDIEDRNPFLVSDLFREIPGAQVVPRGRGLGGVGIRLRGGCIPLYVIDDILMAPPVAIDDVISVNDVEALEIYHGTSAPIDYNGLTTCGVVMIWTRDPVAEGQPFSWGKVLFVVGFGVFAIFGPT